MTLTLRKYEEALPPVTLILLLPLPVSVIAVNMACYTFIPQGGRNRKEYLYSVRVTLKTHTNVSRDSYATG
jgi:hypothetical protein